MLTRSFISFGSYRVEFCHLVRVITDERELAISMNRQVSPSARLKGTNLGIFLSMGIAHFKIYSSRLTKAKSEPVVAKKVSFTSPSSPPAASCLPKLHHSLQCLPASSSP